MAFSELLLKLGLTLRLLRTFKSFLFIWGLSLIFTVQKLKHGSFYFSLPKLSNELFICLYVCEKLISTKKEWHYFYIFAQSPYCIVSFNVPSAVISLVI